MLPIPLIWYQMKSLQIFLFSITVVISACSFYFIALCENVHVPEWLLYLALAYVLFQMVRIYRSGNAQFSDFLYYFGAIVLALPEFAQNDDLWVKYRWLLAFAVCSIVLKPAGDLIKSFKRNQ